MLRPRGAIELLQETLIGEAAATGSAGVVLSDDDLRYVAVNEVACKLLGYSRGELRGVEVSDVLLGEPDGLRLASRAVIDGATRHGNARFKWKTAYEMDVGYVSF